MAGSFHLFRRYQKTAIVGLAVMAMLAFFVLPPLLQMDAGSAGPDNGLVVRWDGGGLRESDLERAVRVRREVNRFLMALQAAATGNDDVEPPFPGDELSIVSTMLFAHEAKANGFVVSDMVINDYLGQWTGDMVPAAQMENVIKQINERAGVTEADIFDALRTVILAQRLQVFFLRGTDFAGAPPGWRWDAFRKLEQGATVEVVPVVVESLSSEVGEPSTAALEKLYKEYGDELPQARSTTPGFREPARARYDAIVAAADVFVAEAEKAVTDEEITKFYDENKEALFKKTAEPPADAAAEPPATGEAAKPDSEPAPKPEPAVDALPTEEPTSESEAAPEDGAGMPSSVIRAVSFRQQGDDEIAEAKAATEPVAAPADAPETDAGAKPADESSPKASKEEPADEKPAATDPAESKPASEKPAEESGGDKPVDGKPAEEGTAEKPADFEPLEKVRDDIRKRLAQQAAGQKLSEAFSSVAAKIAAHSDAVELAIGLGEKVPPAPDVSKLAAEYGLEGVRSDFITPSEAGAGGGIGGSFDLVRSARFGMQQLRWIDMVLSPSAPRFRPVVTRDITGVRYLSWKTEDRPQITPAFSEIRPEVERVWKLLEARPLARKKAEEVAASAKSKTLAEAIAGGEGLEATTVGPFTWLTRGTAPFGSGPMLSNPDGIEMAGEAFMRAVFSLEPGGTAVAFNEPETVCYAVRLVAFEPDDETLRQRFRDVELDPRRLETLAAVESRDAFARWMADIEKRRGVTWVRPPRESESR